MIRRAIPPLLAAALLAFALVACSYPTRNEELATLAPGQGYRWSHLAPGPGGLEDTLLVVTASGGGTRATALALSTLEGLQKLTLPSGSNLAEEVDVISSVSGGSVTAGYFAYAGTDGFETLEKEFIRKDGIAAIAWAGLNPVGLAELATAEKERIDLLIDLLDESLFDGATFASLTARGRRPYLILNAADMAEGTPFSFTQYNFDLICSDLERLKLSVGVSASAAFPVALSPVTLVNYSPCAAQESLRWPPTWVANAGQRTDWYDNPTRVRRGRVAEAYALGTGQPEPEGKAFIHLLDGGIADNLGIAEPFRLLSTADVSPAFFTDISQGRIKRVVFVMVNARSAAISELNAEKATPGIPAMLGSVVSAPIDAASLGTYDRLETLLRERFEAAAAEMPPSLAQNFKDIETFILPIDFDAIADPACRRAFQAIATSWVLPPGEIDALMLAGQALLGQAPKLPEVSAALGLTGAGDLPDLSQACTKVAAAQGAP